MDDNLNIIERLLRYLGSKSERDRFSLIDSFLILLAGTGLISQTLFGENSVTLQGIMGVWFAPFILFTISMFSIFGSWHYCTFLVNRYGRRK